MSRRVVVDTRRTQVKDSIKRVPGERILTDQERKDLLKPRKPGQRRYGTAHNPHLPRGIHPWPVERIFEGKTVCIIGGGPSLKNYDISITKGEACIAVNNSYEIAPWSQVLHFADCSWWQWNGKEVKASKFKGIITTATSDHESVNDPILKRLWRNRDYWSDDARYLYGWDSGTQAVNLAYHLGAVKIVLFGIDMQVGKDGACQWHKKHKRDTRKENYAQKFAPRLIKAIKALEKKGIPVVRATAPGVAEAPLVPVENWKVST